MKPQCKRESRTATPSSMSLSASSPMGAAVYCWRNGRPASRGPATGISPAASSKPAKAPSRHWPANCMKNWAWSWTPPIPGSPAATANLTAACACTCTACLAGMASRMAVKTSSWPDVGMVAASCQYRQELERAAALGVDFVVLSRYCRRRVIPVHRPFAGNAFQSSPWTYPCRYSHWAACAWICRSPRRCTVPTGWPC